MTHSPELEIRAGQAASGLAAAYWAGLGERERRMILWDCPLEDREEFLRLSLKAASHCGVAWLDGAIVGLAWLVPHSPGARSASIHFSFARAGIRHSQAVAASFHRLAARRFESLVALIPWPFRCARDLALGLGYRHAARLRGACWLALPRRLADGDLLVLENTRLAWPDTGGAYARTGN